MNTCVVYSVLMVCQLATGGRLEKRAHIGPPKEPSKSITQSPVDNVSSTSSNMTENSTNTELCPHYQVAHGQNGATKCCVPVFNCPVGYGIKVCDVDGEADQCIPCPPGMVQLNNVSSLNMDEAECYSTKGTETCMIDDTKPSRKFPDVHSCWLKCECKNEDCFYGDDPCACEERKPCAVNHTMNRITGDCEPCPWYSLKNYVGCGTCTIIPDLWRVRNYFPAKPVVTTNKTTAEAAVYVIDSKVEEETDQRRITTTTSPLNNGMVVKPKPHVDSNILIAVAIVISVVIVAVVIVIAVVCIKKRKPSIHTNQLLQAIYQSRYHEPPAKGIKDEKDAEITEIPDDFRMIGNVQRVVPTGRPVYDRGKKRDELPMSDEELGAVGGAELPSSETRYSLEESDDKDDLKEIRLLMKLRRINETENRAVSYGSNREEQQPLLSQVHGVIHPNSGAKPKHTNMNMRRPLQADGRSEKSDGINFVNCTFNNKVFNNVNSSINEDSKKLKMEERQAALLNNLSNGRDENGSHHTCSKERIRNIPTDMQPNLPKKQAVDTSKVRVFMPSQCSDSEHCDGINTSNNANNNSNGGMEMHGTKRKVTDPSNSTHQCPSVGSSDSDNNELFDERTEGGNSDSKFSLTNNSASKAGDRTGHCEIQTDNENLSKDLIVILDEGKRVTEEESPDTTTAIDVNAYAELEQEPECVAEESISSNGDKDVVETKGNRYSDSSDDGSDRDSTGRGATGPIKSFNGDKDLVETKGNRYSDSSDDGSDRDRTDRGAKGPIKSFNDDKDSVGIGGNRQSDSSDEGSDRERNNRGAKGPIKPFNSRQNDNKPIARIGPIRQQSVQEPTMEMDHIPSSALENQELIFLRNQSYGWPDSTMSSVDSYGLAHVSHRLSDVGNENDFADLNPSTIDSSRTSIDTEACDSVDSEARNGEQDDQSSTGSESDSQRRHSRSSPARLSPIGRESPEGCSVPKSCVDGDNVYRPDLQRTYCKQVDAMPVNQVIDNSEQGSDGETELKKPVRKITDHNDARHVSGTEHQPEKVVDEETQRKTETSPQVSTDNVHNAKTKGNSDKELDEIEKQKLRNREADVHSRLKENGNEKLSELKQEMNLRGSGIENTNDTSFRGSGNEKTKDAGKPIAPSRAKTPRSFDSTGGNRIKPDSKMVNGTGGDTESSNSVELPMDISLGESVELPIDISMGEESGTCCMHVLKPFNAEEPQCNGFDSGIISVGSHSDSVELPIDCLQDENIESDKLPKHCIGNTEAP